MAEQESLDLVLSANDRLFADNATVAPATAGEPTVAEITTFAGTNTDTIIYYTGTNTSTDTPTYVYHIDNSGTVTQLESPTTGGSDIFAQLSSWTTNNSLDVVA